MPTCPCGRDFEAAPKRGNARKWCSESCRVKAWKEAQPERPGRALSSLIDFATCAQCGRLYVVRRRARSSDRCCRSVDCRRTATTEYMRGWQRQWTAEHGEPYSAKWREGRREAGRQAIADGRGPRARNPAAANANDQLRQRRLTAGRQGRSYSRREVFDRDDWTCGICEEPVDPDLRFPHPQSATVDHIVPLFLDGLDVLENVRCAHLRCNGQRPRVGEHRAS